MKNKKIYKNMVCEYLKKNVFGNLKGLFRMGEAEP